MPEAPKPTDSETLTTQEPSAPAPLWSGTGLCCEAQGDGIPCRGIDGECESCGRAIPPPDAQN